MGNAFRRSATVKALSSSTGVSENPHRVEPISPLLVETQIFALWTIEDVRELLRRFHSQIHGFSLVETQFESIMSFKPEVAEHVPLDQLFRILDNDDDSRVDGLELLGGIALCCNGTFEEKARFCFELFDFNLNSLISERELTMMIISSVCGMNILTGGSEDNEPEIDIIEALSHDALVRADLNNDGCISLEEFIQWARTNRELMAALEILQRITMNAKLDIQSDDSAPEDDEASGDEMDTLTIALNSRSLKTTETDTENEMKDERFLDPVIHFGVGREDSLVYRMTDHNDLIEKLRIERKNGIKPKWMRQMLHTATSPSSTTTIVNEQSTSQGPDANLHLSGVLGYRQKGLCRNLKYFSIPLSGEEFERFAVYNVANIIVMYSLLSYEQLLYTEHAGEVTAIDVHRTQQLVVSADSTSRIHIWTIDKFRRPRTVGMIRTLINEGIKIIKFSPDGKRIACVGMDQDHTICLYDIASGELISSIKGISSPRTIHDMSWSLDGREIMIVGRFTIKFFIGAHTNKRTFDQRIGKIGSSGKRQNFYSCTYLRDGTSVVGCASGEIYCFRSYQCYHRYQAHGIREGVFALYFNETTSTLLSGGEDAFIKTWDMEFKEIGSTINLYEDVAGNGQADLVSVNPSVVSIEQYRGRLLVATLGCDIVEVTLPRSPQLPHELEVLMRGHAYGEVWGLDAHPNRDEFVTVGDDRRIRLWSLRTLEQINERRMPQGARAVAYNGNGNIICIGLLDGTVALMDMSAAQLRVYSTWRHSHQRINDVRFSPDSSLLAVASEDGNVYLYFSTDKRTYHRKAVCRGHQSPVTSLDFTFNGNMIQTNGADGTLLYFSAKTGLLVKPGTATATSNLALGTTWATWRSIYGWPVSGICGTNELPVSACEGISDLGVLVSGDLSGQLYLRAFPCVEGDDVSQRYSAHAGKISRVRFSWSRRQVLTLGAVDRSVMVWRHSLEMEENDFENTGWRPTMMEIEAQKYAVRNDIPHISLRTVEHEARVRGIPISQAIARRQAIDLTSTQIPSSKQETATHHLNSTVMPWKSACVEPTLAQVDPNATDVDVSLAWVHGYRCDGCRNNVLYAADGAVVFPAAALVVVHQKAAASQRFLLNAHTDEVLSLTSHPTAQIFASSEVGSEASIIVWRTKDTTVLRRLPAVHRFGCSLLAFNSDGNLLASVGMDDANTLTVHSWAWDALLFSTPTSSTRLTALAFLQSYGPGETEPGRATEVEAPTIDVLVTGGIAYLKFWWWYGRNIESQTAIWGDYITHRSATVLCVGSPAPGICITGSSDGALLVWKDFAAVSRAGEGHSLFGGSEDDPSMEYSVHESAAIVALWCVAGQISIDEESVLAMSEEESRSIARVYVGDRQGRIGVWFLAHGRKQPLVLILRRVTSLAALQPQIHGVSVRSLCERDGVVLIGTSAAEILEVLEKNIPHVDLAHSLSAAATASETVDLQNIEHVIPSGDETTLAIQTNFEIQKEIPLLNPFPAHINYGPLLNKSVAAEALILGHGPGDVSALAEHPLADAFFTTGNDGTLRCWRLGRHALVTYAQLPCKSRALAIDPASGTRLAISMVNGALAIVPTDIFTAPLARRRGIGSIDGAIVPEDVTGKLAALESLIRGGVELQSPPGESRMVRTSSASDNIDVAVECVVRAAELHAHWSAIVLRFTPDGETLLVGCTDHRIRVFDSATLTQKGEFSAHMDRITSIDVGINVAVGVPFSTVPNSPDDTLLETIFTAALSNTLSSNLGGRSGHSRENLFPPILTPMKRDQWVRLIESVDTSASPPAIISRLFTATHDELPSQLIPPRRPVALSDLVIRSTSSNGELRYWNLSTATELPSPAMAKDVHWLTTTAPYGWSLQGLWPSQPSHPTDDDLTSYISSAAREITAVCVSHSVATVPVVAAVNSYGQLRLFNFPCVAVGSPDKSYSGHVKRIATVTFSGDDRWLLTTGGTDHCVFVWSTDIQSKLREKAAAEVLIASNVEPPNRIFSSLLIGRSFSSNADQSGSSSTLLLNDTTSTEDDQLFLIHKLEAIRSDPRGASQAWKTASLQPSSFNDHENKLPLSPPLGTLELTHAYGYRGWDTRNNLSYGDTSERIVYHIASVGIVRSSGTESNQTVNTEHSSDISCLTVHPEGHIVASGELGVTPKIVLWDANTGLTIRVILFHKSGISAIAFTASGKEVVSCGMDEDRLVAVHCATSGTLLAKGKGGRGISIYTLSTAPTGASFVTGGRNHVRFWDLPAGGSRGELSSKTGLFAVKAATSRTAVSSAFLGSDCVTGMRDGTLLLWKDRTNTRFVTAHRGAVTAMTSFLSTNSARTDGRESGPRILTGGEDGLVHMWDLQLSRIWSLDMNTTTPRSVLPSIQALSSRDNRLLIGTKGAEIYQVGLLGGCEAVRIVEGHFGERTELSSLAVHPSSTKFVTAGDDGVVRLWDSKLRMPLASVTVGSNARAIAYSPDASTVAVALIDGTLQLLSDNLTTVMRTLTAISSSWAVSISFSPDNRLIGLGCADGTLCIIDVKTNSCCHRCHGHTAAITALDFSCDSTIVRTASADFKLCYWDMNTGRQIHSEAILRDVHWATHTCPLGWAVQGVWSADGNNEILSVDASVTHPINGERLLAVGDNARHVRIYRYPAFREGTVGHVYKGHSESVISVRFSSDGQTLFTIGGEDKAILQFSVKY